VRFHEIFGGIHLPVSNEEQELMDLIDSREGLIGRSDLEERQRELARKMVSRGVLDRVQRDGSLHYRISRNAEARRPNE
jgi:hypothetical protein